MVSNLLRRSGVAVCKVSGLLNWQPDVIVQVGIGGYHREVDVMKEVWPELRFIGFEPHPDVMNTVKKDYPGELYQCAIADYVGKSSLFFRTAHKDGSSLFRLPPSKEQSKIEVEVRTLDAVFPPSFGRSKRVLLWLDCEGAELLALKGGERFARAVDMINIEMTANPCNPEWGDHVETHFWLLEHNFKRLTTHTNRSPEGQYDCIYVKPHLFDPKLCTCPCMLERDGNVD